MAGDSANNGLIRADTGSLVDFVHRAVREAILAGRYGPGEAISEVGLASVYDVARPTARAAVERLIGEGLLARSGRKAASVPVFSTAEISQLYEARIVIEGHVIRELARRRIVPPDALAANAALRANASTGYAAGVIDADVTLHTALVRAQGNSRLSRAHALLMSEAHLLMAHVQTHQLLRAETIADEHEALFAAIARGDADETEDALRSHLEHAETKLLRNVRSA